jgi:hypothetical protein
MQIFLKIIALTGLVLTLVPSFFVFASQITLTAHYHLMLIGMVLWFISAPFWKKTNKT